MAYIINLKYGKVIANYQNNFISKNTKINLLVDDNSFILTYFNSENLQTEIWNIELFRTNVENKFLEIIKRKFKSDIPL